MEYYLAVRMRRYARPVVQTPHPGAPGPIARAPELRPARLRRGPLDGAPRLHRPPGTDARAATLREALRAPTTSTAPGGRPPLPGLGDSERRRYSGRRRSLIPAPGGRRSPRLRRRLALRCDVATTRASTRPLRPPAYGIVRRADGRPRAERSRGSSAARERARADVDRVVALVHAGRLEVVGRVRERGMAQQVGQPDRGPIRPAPRCSCRSSRDPRSDFESLRWIMTSRSSPIRASKSARKASMASAGSRGRCRHPRRARRRGRSRRARREARARPAARRWRPAPRRSSRARRRRRPSSRARGSAMRRPRCPGSSTSDEDAARGRRRAGRCRPRPRRPRCDPMWTFTNRAPNPGAARSSCARTPTERSKKSSDGPARLTRYEAWMATGPMSEGGQPRRGTRGARPAARPGAARRSGCRRRPGSRRHRSRAPARPP